MPEPAPAASMLVGRPAPGTAIRRVWAAVLERPLLASVGVGAIALVFRLLLLPWFHIPQPAVHDEFSYLLAADTFAHGRLTNPTHPLWIHFETFNELSHPTYASKYPPGMGMMLAFGQVVFGQPWAGVLIGMAVLCGAITWGAWVWLPPGWAIVAGLLAMLRLTGGYWTESYWGGTAAAIGGALLVGAFARLRERTSGGAATVYGIGLAILANTRPFEGLVLALVCSGFLIVRYLRRPEARDGLLGKVVVPITCVLVPVFLWMGYYNYRVTGKALTLPYEEYEARYSLLSGFLWPSTPRPEPHYDFEILRDLWVSNDARLKIADRQHVAANHLSALSLLGTFFFGVPLLVFVALHLRRMLREPAQRTALTLLILFYAGLTVECWLFPHYFAPGTILIFVIAAGAVRAATDRFPAILPRALVAGAMLWCVAIAEVPRLMHPTSALAFRDRLPFLVQRRTVLDRLEQTPGEQLVLVDYGPQHCAQFDWVYNSADIDASRIVWARAMGPGKDGELVRYYPGRHVWLLHDNGRVTLQPYGGGRVETLPVETKKAVGGYCP